MKQIALMPSSGLHLNHYYCDEATARRFADVFRETWLQIPMADRRAMVKDWRDCKAEMVSTGINEATRATLAQMFYPSISIDTFIQDQDARDEMPLGCFFRKYGRSIQFWSPAVEIMPDDVLSNLIAHELGHAYLKATGEADEINAESIDGKGTVLFLGDKVNWEEIRVYEVMEDWGFDDDVISAWCAIHRPRLLEIEAELKEPAKLAA
jgi:hypothetical protein